MAGLEDKTLRDDLLHFEDLYREYQTNMMTASSVLIAAPLLALPLLASDAWIARPYLGAIAFVMVASASCFSVCLALLMKTSRKYAAQMALNTIGPLALKVAPRNAEGREAFEKLLSTSPKYYELPLANKAFLLGIVLLLGSLFVLVAVFFL